MDWSTPTISPYTAIAFGSCIALSCGNSLKTRVIVETQNRCFQSLALIKMDEAAGGLSHDGLLQ